MPRPGKKAGRPSHKNYNAANRRYLNKLRRARRQDARATIKTAEVIEMQNDGARWIHKRIPKKTQQAENAVAEYRKGYRPGKTRRLKAK